MGGVGAARDARAAVVAKGCNAVATFAFGTPGALTLHRWQPIGSQPRVRNCEPGGTEINFPRQYLRSPEGDLQIAAPNPLTEVGHVTS